MGRLNSTLEGLFMTLNVFLKNDQQTAGARQTRGILRRVRSPQHFVLKNPSTKDSCFLIGPYGLSEAIQPERPPRQRTALAPQSTFWKITPISSQGAPGKPSSHGTFSARGHRSREPQRPERSPRVAAQRPHQAWIAGAKEKCQERPHTHPLP